MNHDMFAKQSLMLPLFVVTEIAYIGKYERSDPPDIRKVKLLSKNSILSKPQHFHEFFTQFFFDNFSREIKVVNS